MIVTLVVSDFMVIGKQVDISLMVMENTLSKSCIVLLMIFTSKDDDVICLLISTLNIGGEDTPDWL